MHNLIRLTKVSNRGEESVHETSRSPWFSSGSGRRLAAAFVPALEAAQAPKRSDDDLTRLTLSEASDLVRARKVSAVELTTPA